MFKNPEQWGLLGRSQRRLVIKEVNPRACEFFLVNYRPKVIFLMRHPMAVGLSYRKLGWLAVDADFWKTMAEMQGSALSNAWDVLQTYSDCKVVSYEELCAEPAKLYQDIFEFAGLVWNEDIEILIDTHNSKGNLNDPYDTRRNSKNMAQSWRKNVTRQEIDDVKSVFNRYKLPRYQLQNEWYV